MSEISKTDWNKAVKIWEGLRSKRSELSSRYRSLRRELLTELKIESERDGFSLAELDNVIKNRERIDDLIYKSSALIKLIKNFNSKIKKLENKYRIWP